MKKFWIIILFLLLGAANFEIIVSADSTATAMGFTVDTNQYGTVKNYKYTSAYSYVVKNGINYAIGFSKIKGAVYEDCTNDDWALVILQSTAEPKDPRIPEGLFKIKYQYDGVTRSQSMYSDIDNSSIAWGYSAFITSANYVMEQPSPRAEPNTVVYTASIEIGNETKVSGSVSFDDNELDLDFSHSASENVFDVDFLYSSNLLDNSYMNDLTYNKGTFLVDMTTKNNSTAGVFVNTVQLTSTFYAFGWTGYTISTPISVTLYY